MSLASKILQKADKTGVIANPVRGKWFAIKFTPDLFAGDSISIGVGFINSAGVIRTRLADDYQRLACFYDDRLNISDVEFLAGLLDEALAGLHEEEWLKSNFGPSVTFTDASYAAGRSETEIIDSLFFNAVPIARTKVTERDKQPRQRFEQESTTCNKIGKSLGDRYKNIASKFHPNGQAYDIDNQGHRLKLHFRDEGRAAGYVASALIADVWKAEVRVRRGVDSLRTLRNCVPEERCGLFVVRPGETHGLNDSFLNQFDDLLEEIRWRLDREQIDLRDADDTDLMADQIADWYNVA
ncbi:hypothetical protein [Congregibacter litoralis]|uniref:DUF3037 domain-containing protein n=1 Tax=Congregibacter litoralis KT71 TaxID=314285 RepID=A4A7P4_9GAMM|nr:hypothetical protein [Congregibacter litoralis]EAQ97689.1 hypothetical protein KT71_14004 [Congregibacter litoralis KT71]